MIFRVRYSGGAGTGVGAYAHVLNLTSNLPAVQAGRLRVQLHPGVHPEGRYGRCAARITWLNMALVGKGTGGCETSGEVFYW